MKDIFKLKWKDLYPKEKRFIFFTFIFIITTISIFFLKQSIYLNILNNSNFDSLILFKIDKFKIYKYHEIILEVMKQTPKAVEKANNIVKYSLILNIVLYIILAFPIKWRSIFKNTSQGDAEWAQYDDLGVKRFFITNKYSKVFETNFLEKAGVILGEAYNNILRDNAKTHILISAPTRTGKGVSIIIPTLVDSWNESVLVLDIKGENYQMTSEYRRKYFKNKILKFSPKSEDSCKFNPLLEIRYLTDREVEDAKKIADLIVQEENSKDKFWEESGSAFLVSVILFCLYEKNGNASLADVVNFITDPSEPLEMRLQEFLNGKEMNISKSTKEKLMKIYSTEKELIKKGYHPTVLRGFSDLISKGEKVSSSVVATVKAKLNVFELPTVAKNTSTSDFKLIDLMASKEPISLYLVIEPGDLQSLAPLLRIILTQCISALTPEMDYSGNNNKIKFNNRLLMVLDEFPAIGKMELFEKAIGFVAGYGMKMMIVVQSLDQLNKIYTKDNAFMSNCQTQVFYTTNDNQTSEYISKTIGNKTIKQYSYSSGNSSSRTTSYVGVPLIRPEEVRRLPLDKILILNAGKKPIMSKKLLWFYDDRFKHKVNLPIEKTDALKIELDMQEKTKKGA